MSLRPALVELAVVAAVAGLFVTMPAWRSPERPETYPLDPAAFAARVEAMSVAHAAGTSHDGVAVVRPPPGDVFVLAQRWRFSPLLELEAGRTYRLHLSSADILHGVAIAGQERLVVPGEVQVVTLAPSASGHLILQCSEYCGLDHSRMAAVVKVIIKNNSKK